MTSPRSDKLRATFKAKQAKGEVTGRLPIGYRTDTSVRGMNLKVPDAELQLLIKVARRLHKEGISVRKIAVVMAPLGLQSNLELPLRAGTLWRLLNSSSD